MNETAIVAVVALIPAAVIYIKYSLLRREHLTLVGLEKDFKSLKQDYHDLEMRLGNEIRGRDERIRFLQEKELVLGMELERLQGLESRIKDFMGDLPSPRHQQH